MIQRDALTILKTGANVFVTGPAGSGKTFVINEYIKYLKEHSVPLGLTASTGIAATHIGGMTIHAWSGISVKDYLSDDDIAEIAERGYVKKKVSEAQVLVIDEVSMLHHFRFDMVNRVVKYIKKSDKPFGGMQVVLCGDFFQLPPVSRMGETQAHFIYESEAWKEAAFTICYLEENYRQGNDLSTQILNEIRSGEVSELSYEHLMSRHVSHSQPDSETKIEIEPTRLYTHNVDVDTVNEKALLKVSGPESAYEMTSKGRKPLIETLKKSCLAPEVLKLRKGARVMCVKNNFDAGYVNGTLGVVVSAGFGVSPVIRTASSPEYPEGRLITIEPATWAIEDDGKVLAEIQQYPLRLAWAITVHKSQGMSLDAVEVDLSKSFEPGMGYVALSRARTLHGLRILGINQRALQVHPEVLEYDRFLKEQSIKAEKVLATTHQEEIIQVQKEFLARVAPLHSMGSKKKKEPKLSTFEKTALLIREKKSLKEIAKARELVPDTIIAHIEELISGGKETGESLSLNDIAYLKHEISSSHLQKLEKAFEALSEKFDDELIPLSPIKSSVGANITWNEIRLARVLLGYFK